LPSNFQGNRKNGFDGAVLDFSYLNIVELGSGFTDLIAKVGAQLHRNEQHLILVVPVSNSLSK
jgi:hypothetical protein